MSLGQNVSSSTLVALVRDDSNNCVGIHRWNVPSVEISCPNIVVTTAAMHVLNEAEEQLRHKLVDVVASKFRTMLEVIDALTTNKSKRSATLAQT